jgi:hypothetical protein
MKRNRNEKLFYLLPNICDVRSKIIRLSDLLSKTCDKQTLREYGDLRTFTGNFKCYFE